MEIPECPQIRQCLRILQTTEIQTLTFDLSRISKILTMGPQTGTVDLHLGVGPQEKTGMVDLQPGLVGTYKEVLLQTLAHPIITGIMVLLIQIMDLLVETGIMEDHQMVNGIKMQVHLMETGMEGRQMEIGMEGHPMVIGMEGHPMAIGMGDHQTQITDHPMETGMEDHLMEIGMEDHQIQTMDHPVDPGTMAHLTETKMDLHTQTGIRVLHQLQELDFH